MALKTDVSSDGSLVTFEVTGNVDFSIFSSLKKVAKEHISKDTHIVIDFANEAKLHDSGLGTLISLTRQSENCISLVNCTPEIISRISHSSYQARFRLAD